jgi:transcription elongation GreA/GreB family factor
MAEQLTQEQHAKLAAELAELEGPRRQEIVDAIRVARGHGDLSENFEYHAAKNEQALLERRIAILRDRLEHSQIVEAGDVGVVAVGSRVVVVDEAGERLEVELSALGGRNRRSARRSSASASARRSTYWPRAAPGEPGSPRSSSFMGSLVAPVSHFG